LRIEEALDIRPGLAANNSAKPLRTDKKADRRDARSDFRKPDPEYKDGMLEKIIDDLNKKLNTAGRELRCGIHEKTGQVMVKVVDTDTGSVIREIPPEKSLDILAKILEQSGLLVDEKT